MADQDAQKIALAELEALLKIPGRLRIITNEIQPKMRMAAKDRRSALAEGADPELLKKPSTFVHHNVTRIEPHPTQEGVYLAYSDEGDYTMGYPEALVKRLSDWRNG